MDVKTLLVLAALLSAGANGWYVFKLRAKIARLKEANAKLRACHKSMNLSLAHWIGRAIKTYAWQKRWFVTTVAEEREGRTALEVMSVDPDIKVFELTFGHGEAPSNQLECDDIKWSPAFELGLREKGIVLPHTYKELFDDSELIFKVLDTKLSTLQGRP